MIEPQSLLTPAEIEAQIHNLARHGEGADQRWALKVLHAQTATEAALPEPLADVDLMDRLVRVMKPSGKEACQVAFRRAFPKNRDEITERPVLIDADLDIDAKSRIMKIKSLRDLNRAYPEIRRPGVPKGYPLRRGLEAIKNWAREQARRIEVERAQKDTDASCEASGIPVPTLADAPTVEPLEYPSGTPPRPKHPLG